MKLGPRDAPGYFARPDPDSAGLLIYGEDAMRVALRRQQVIAALIGPEGEAEMRLTRIPGSEARKDPALLLDALKARGFFPGPRVAFLEEATDTLAKPVAAALQDWQRGDAHLIVTAAALKATSALRKLFEAHRTARAVGIYNDPPSRAEIEADLARSGLRDVDRSAMEALTALARELDPGDFRQTVEKVALYKLGDSTPLSPQEVALCAPSSTEAGVDELLHLVAEGRSAEIGPMMARLEGQGSNAVTLIIMATRHFRALYAVASDPGGPEQGASRARPPIYGPRRDRMVRQTQAWGAFRLESALGILTDTDLQLRSAGQHAPALALVERCFIRLAMLSARG